MIDSKAGLQTYGWLVCCFLWLTYVLPIFLLKYLQGVLQALETSACATQPVATTNNAWMTAFHNVYSEVATDCHLPQGKNRHHKFKDKMVELWYALEEEIMDTTKPSATTAHPLYALGIRQLDTYRSVARDTDNDMAKKRKVVAQHLPKQSPSRKKIRMGHPHGTMAMLPLGGMHGVPTNGTMPRDYNPRDMSAVLLRVDALQSTLIRLEQSSMQQVAPKLPSPLMELHRIKMMGPNENDWYMMRSQYAKSVGAFLEQATQQANNSNHPALLPTLLEGLELLKRYNMDDEGISASINYTYTHVLKLYLKLINPHCDLEHMSKNDAVEDHIEQSSL
jgi:hypothetical protein